MSNLRFGSFRDLQLHIISDEKARHAADLERAAKLRKIAPAQAASLAKRGVPGPPVVR